MALFLRGTPVRLKNDIITPNSDPAHPIKAEYTPPAATRAQAETEIRSVKTSLAQYQLWMEHMY